MEVVDIAWLAGLVEGEGCFPKSSSPTIQIQMTDEDVIRKAARLFNVTPVGPNDRGPGRKQSWKLSFHSNHAIAWMMTLYSFLGNRRRARIREILAVWHHQQSRNMEAKCHPNREHHAKNLCYECYYKMKNQISKLKRKAVREQLELTI